METLTAYIVPVIVGICLVVGYLIKTFAGADRIIPVVVTVLGVGLAIWINWNTGITPEIILGGAVSGLASTGLHQMFKQWMDKGGAA